MSKKHQLVALTLGVSLTFSLTGVHSVFAETGQSVHKQHLKEKRSKLHSLEDKKSQAHEKAKELEDEIAKRQQKVSKTQKELKKNQSSINQLKKDITEAQDRINKRDKKLKKRVATMYKNGGSVAYLDVLLGSQGFNDFLDRLMALNLITSQDKKMLDEQKDDKKKLDSTKKLIVKKLDKLQDQLDSLNDISDDLKDEKQKQEDLADNLDDKGKKIKKDIESVQQAIETAQVNESQQHEQTAKDEGSENGQSSKSSKHSTTNKKDQQTVQATAKDSGSKKSSHSNGNKHNNNTTSDNSSPKISSHGSGSVNDIIQASQQYIGNSTYKMGRGRTQADIQNGLFDCSAFVHWAYNQIGVSVGTSTSGLSSTGAKVSRSSLKPGDMVFFDTYKTNGHVGIYIGGNQFLGAQTSTGVDVASMNNVYWKNKFNHAQRVMN